jgi:hypothetical protein
MASYLLAAFSMTQRIVPTMVDASALHENEVGVLRIDITEMIG